MTVAPSEPRATTVPFAPSTVAPLAATDAERSQLGDRGRRGDRRRTEVETPLAMMCGRSVGTSNVRRAR